MASFPGVPDGTPSGSSPSSKAEAFSVMSGLGSPPRSSSTFLKQHLSSTQSGIRMSGEIGATSSPRLANLRSSASTIAPLTPTASLSNRQADAYISELLSYSLERLRKEPELLAEEKQRIERSSQHAALHNYRAFIRVADTLATVHDELATVSTALHSLLEETPKLATACEQFSRSASDVMDQHAQNKLLMSNQGTVVEVVEVAQLMETCVRNGVYDEALDLHAFVTRFALLHPHLRVVRLLQAEVNAVADAMLQQLLGRLRAPLALPECLRVMGHLRRMAAFSEAELRQQFLACREAWLAGLEAELDERQPYEYLKAVSDLHRLHLFDIVMQYRAVFFDGPGGASQDGSASYPGAAQQPDSKALHSWVHYRVGRYVTLLDRHLPRISDGGSLASVLENCLYCGSSLSRVGLDFSALLHPLLERLALQLFSANLTAAVDAFQTRLEGHKWVAMPAFSSRLPKPQAPEPGKAANGDKASEATDLAPPYALMEHPPLALLVNNVLMAFNELRHYALLSLCRPLSKLLQQALEQAISTMLHYHHTHRLQAADATLFRSTAHALTDVAAPYLISCFLHIFPGGATKVDVSQSTALLRQALTAAAAAAV